MAAGATFFRKINKFLITAHLQTALVKGKHFASFNDLPFPQIIEQPCAVGIIAMKASGRPAFQINNLVKSRIESSISGNQTRSAIRPGCNTSIEGSIFVRRVLFLAKIQIRCAIC